MSDIRVAAEQAYFALIYASNVLVFLQQDTAKVDAALASLEAALAALPGDKGNQQAGALAQAIREDGCCHHWKEAVRFLDHLAAPSSSQVPPIAGRDGASDAPSDQVVVPRVPTQLMCQAGQDKAREWPHFPLRISPIYQAMLAAAPRQVAHSSQAQGELSVNPVVTNNGRMNEENQNG